MGTKIRNQLRRKNLCRDYAVPTSKYIADVSFPKARRRVTR